MKFERPRTYRSETVRFAIDPYMQGLLDLLIATTPGMPPRLPQPWIAARLFEPGLIQAALEHPDHKVRQLAHRLLEARDRFERRADRHEGTKRAKAEVLEIFCTTPT